MEIKRGWLTILACDTHEEIARSRVAFDYVIDRDKREFRPVRMVTSDSVIRTCLADVAIFDAPHHGTLLMCIGQMPVCRDVDRVDVKP